MNKTAGWLTGSACYLAGPMTDVPDLGAKWRNVIKPHLQAMGIVVYDPCDKRIPLGDESHESREVLKQLQANGDLQAVREWMKPIRRVDLRMVDLSSFLIVRLDGTPTMGTFEEIDKATIEQKPILVWLDGEFDKSNINPWLPCQIPPEYFFESMDELLGYLAAIHLNAEHPTDRRWMLFDFADLYSEALDGCEHWNVR